MKIKSLFRRGGQGQTASSKNLHSASNKDSTTIKPPPPTTNGEVLIKNNNRIDLKDNVIPVHNGDARHHRGGLIEATSLPNTLDLNDGEVAMQTFASVQEQLEIMAKENDKYQDEIRLLLGEKKKLQVSELPSGISAFILALPKFPFVLSKAISEVSTEMELVTYFCP